MHANFDLSRRRLISYLSVVAVGGLARPVVAGERQTALANLASAAISPGIPSAIGLIQITGERIGEPLILGVKSHGSTEPARIGDRWHIGSNAKSMTATMIARLVERGTLNWSTRLSEMLPDIAMREEYRRIVLPDLLSHRGGLPQNSAAGVARMPDDDPRSGEERRRDYIAAALMEAPIGPVASGAGSYSNTGFVIAGAIAERATGMTFEALMRREVFEPLGMTSVGFGGTPPGDIAGHYKGAPVHGEDGDNPDFLRPAGGLYLSLGDWGAYIVDQMKGQHGRGRLLSAESYQFLHMPQPGSQNGLGWGLEAAPGGKPMWSHNGSNGRWFATVAMLPQEGRAVAVATNAAGDEVERAVNRLVVRSLGLA